MRRAAALALVLIAALACRESPQTAAGEARRTERAPKPDVALIALGAPEELTGPFAEDAAEPFLEATPDGELFMSWIERDAVMIAKLEGESWSLPRAIVAADDLFVNWADFPSLHAFDDGSLAAHWLQKSGSGTYAYDVRFARSSDGGAMWTAPLTPHDDGTQTEHGFVSLGHAPGSDELQIVWLDGRLMTSHGEGHGGGDMTLRWGRFSADGEKLEERELDRRTCECCQTAMTMTPLGAVVAYRDRSESEVRDIAVVRQTPAGWTPPAIVHEDGWTIPGCPVNGPQLASLGPRVALAWFTAPAEEGIVNLAFSDDSGARWSKPVRVDGGNAVGRVDVAMPSAEQAVVVWLERAGEGAEIRARVVARDGSMQAPVVLGKTASARASGFPRMALAGDHVYVAWTEPGESSQIRIARLEVKR